MSRLTSTSPGLGAPARIGTVSGGLTLAVGKRDRLIHGAHVHSHARRGRVSRHLNLQTAGGVWTRQHHGGFASLLRDHLNWIRVIPRASGHGHRRGCFELRGLGAVGSRSGRSRQERASFERDRWYRHGRRGAGRHCRQEPAPFELEGPGLEFARRASQGRESFPVRPRGDRPRQHWRGTCTRRPHRLEDGPDLKIKKKRTLEVITRSPGTGRNLKEGGRLRQRTMNGAAWEVYGEPLGSWANSRRSGFT